MYKDKQEKDHVDLNDGSKHCGLSSLISYLANMNRQQILANVVFIFFHNGAPLDTLQSLSKVSEKGNL